MTDFVSKMADSAPLSEDDQKKMGQTEADGMRPEYVEFCKKISSKIEAKEIDYLKPDTLIDQAAYEALPDEETMQIDKHLLNIAVMLGHVYEFYKSTLTPDACTQLETMIDQLWDMKKRAGSPQIFKF